MKKLSTLLVFTALMLASPGRLTVQASPERQETAPLSPTIIYPIQQDLSPALAILGPTLQAEEGSGESHPPLPFPKVENAIPEETNASDPLLQSFPAMASMPATDFNFDGVNSSNSVLPPDTNGDIGPNHYVQWVNLRMAIWELDRINHTATLVYGPTAGNAIWSGFGGACQDSNQGDPIVLYDPLADRWLISQFALPNFPGGPYYQCIAVSQTGNPTGAWYRYGYIISSTKMNDYPHFGVWIDGYYMSVNQFVSGTTWGGAGVAVFERDKMLQGLPARVVFFDLYSTNPAFGGMLPSDLDGPPPPAGSPNYFEEVDDSSWIGPQDALSIWEFRVNWSNPASSTFGNNGQPNLTVPVAGFAPMNARVPQPNTSVRLDPLFDRLMHRLQYRNFGNFATLVSNHTVDAGSGRAAVRWYELRNPGTGWIIQNQGTYAGDGANLLHRWMASAAMDQAGDIAIGYSRSSSTVYPGIAYAGRLVDDAPNTLPQGEAILTTGNGSQTHPSGRWGDYTMLAVDPTDDCTFWYTNEYYSITGSANWRTRIGSFVFPSCLGSPKGLLQGTVTSSGMPLADAIIHAGSYSTQTGPNGFYSFPALPVGTYIVTASAYGYQPVSVSGVGVLLSSTTTQDFSLTALPQVEVHGWVSDGSGQGWPLYARLDISVPGHSQIVFTDPLTGAYSVYLPSGISHGFQVSAVLAGYQMQNVPVTPVAPDTTQDFTLVVDTNACIALGYSLVGSCSPSNGGLLVGHVQDANTGVALNGATVNREDAPGDLATSFSTPDDTAQDDGLYILFSSTGQWSFTASKNTYGSDTQNAAVVDRIAVQRNFSLPAGRLVASPTLIVKKVNAGEVVTATLTLSNTGTLPAIYSVTEVDAPAQILLPTGPFADATRHTSPKRLGDLNAQAVYEYNPPQVASLPGGQVLDSWLSGLAHPWGIAYDTRRNKLWIGDVALDGGDDRLHSFLPDGTRQDESIDTAPSRAAYAASMVFNPFSGNFWQAPVGADNCPFEVDPIANRLTGGKMCPAFDQSQRGLAYNPLNQTFYSGSWTNGILYHFDKDGTILDSANLDLNISGLAFNPSTHHLFVLSNAAAGFDVYVLDSENGYANLGGFDIAGLGDYEQAGLSMDCDGHLWVVNQETGLVLEVESGEAAACAYADITWLSVVPNGGTLPNGAAQTLELNINSSAAVHLRNSASLVISNDTPYGPAIIQIELNIGNFFNLPLLLK